MSAADRSARHPRALELTASARAAMVALGFIPLLHVVATLAPLVLVAMGRAGWPLGWVSPFVLFLLPPLVVRASTLWRPLACGRVPPQSFAFLHWWFTAQWQVVFARLPFLEEMVRIVPGLYSLWLRLWGARIGSLIYWSPGVAILDRPLVEIGSRVVFGVGARLNPHALAPSGRPQADLFLAPISIGDDAFIGAYSLLLPGCIVSPGEVTPPLRSVHAFTQFEGGRRQ